MERDFNKLEQSIGYKFKNRDLLKKALTHKSYANEEKIESNEKFEFLGDSILEFISSKYLFNEIRNLTEGEMTKVRAEVVCEKSLYQVALKHNFSDFLYVGKSERKNKGNERPAILADSVEAVIAAIYFDADLETAEKFIIDNLKDAVKISSQNIGMKDFKTVLQEKVQVHKNGKIDYELVKESGPDHDKTFIVAVKINSEEVAKGSGHTKKKAEMEAAKKALELIEEKKISV